MPLRCSKAASVMVAWLQPLIFSLSMPLRCTKAASVTCVHHLMFSALSTTKCPKSPSTMAVRRPLGLCQSSSPTCPAFAPLARGKHALHRATLPLITVPMSSQGKSATACLSSRHTRRRLQASQVSKNGNSNYTNNGHNGGLPPKATRKAHFTARPVGAALSGALPTQGHIQGGKIGH